eukprot:m.26058 g.26058  ORF g.26058 m.26058 type:complete len:170 (-) comp7765_c0_seq2:7-516(-)
MDNLFWFHAPPLRLLPDIFYSGSKAEYNRGPLRADTFYFHPHSPVKKERSHGEEKNVWRNGETHKHEMELEFEISPEFLDFMHVSAKHKIDRDRKKKKTFSEQRDKSNFGKQNADLKVFPEKQRLMRKGLYGIRLGTIECVEANANHHADTDLDKHNPILWPSLPLRDL